MGKKWYNLFVVTANQPGETEPAAGSSGAPKPAAAPPARASRAAERVSDIPAAHTEVKFADPVEGLASMEQIYSSAQIATPAHGYNILKVADMLQNEHIRSLPGDVKRKSVLVALDAAGVKVLEIIEDAVRRDRALDTFENVLQKRLDDLRASKEAENRRIEEEVQQKLNELRARVQENNKALVEEQESLKAWRLKKQSEEARIAEAVSYFVAENPITASAPRPSAAGNPAPKAP
jgi:hypothetical protein